MIHEGSTTGFRLGKLTDRRINTSTLLIEASMRYHELPIPEHPAKRERPRDIARLYVLKAELTDMEAIQASHGSYYMVSVEKLPVIDAFIIEVLCPDSNTALALTVAWNDYIQTSPDR
jgi:hypothetical protein